MNMKLRVVLIVAVSLALGAPAWAGSCGKDELVQAVG